MFVTLALTVAIWVQKNFISSAEGGKGSRRSHLSRLGSLQSQQINYSVHLIQIDFLTQITMLSSRSGHVSLIREPE